jgi:phospholipid transport system transporter-binding protein
METTVALFNQGLALQGGRTELVVDLAQVEAVDSSALSLMLAWLRTAQRSNVKLAFVNTPDNLLSLAELYGVADSLPLRGAGQ